MLEWDDLRFVLAVARHGSLTAAARALRVTQPTMGRRLEGLEERLSVRLFERTPAGVVVTELGAALLEDAERMEAAAFAAERRIASRDTGMAGTVRVTSLEWLGSRVLAPILGEFCDRNPGVGVELLADDRVFNLSRREADIAVRHVRFEGGDLVQRKLADISYGLYASAAYLDQHGAPDFATGCAGHALVTLHEEARHLDEVRWLLDRVAPRAHIVFRSNSRGAQADAAEAGAGLVMLPRCMGDGSGSLRRLMPPLDVPGREVWLGYHRDMRDVPRVRALVGFVAEALLRRKPVLAPP